MEPIVLEFEVEASVGHAFRIWTEACSMWWPRSHSVGQSDDLKVVFEPFVGGRIYERSSDGTEHQWGMITVWDPPSRVDYTWHIFLSPDMATNVSVTFTETSGGSLVRLENSGFEVFGPAATERVGRVGGAWETIAGQYRDAF